MERYCWPKGGHGVEDIRIKGSIGLSVARLILIKKPESAEVT